MDGTRDGVSYSVRGYIYIYISFEKKPRVPLLPATVNDNADDTSDTTRQTFYLYRSNDTFTFVVFTVQRTTDAVRFDNRICSSNFTGDRERANDYLP